MQPTKFFDTILLQKNAPGGRSLIIKNDDVVEWLCSLENVRPCQHHRHHNFVSDFDTIVAMPKIY